MIGFLFGVGEGLRLRFSVRPLTRGVSSCRFLHTLLLILDTLISIFFLCIMQWDEKELDTQFTPNVYFWTLNSGILAKALIRVGVSVSHWSNCHKSNSQEQLLYIRNYHLHLQ